jgi:hypothetical protein
MSDFATLERSPKQRDNTIFTILGGTTIPDRAVIVREYCREGSRVELRRPRESIEDDACIYVWLECSSLFGLVKVWKKIGHVPVETAAALLPATDANSSVVAYGKVKAVYAPAGRDEAAVTVEIHPLPRV